MASSVTSSDITSSQQYSYNLALLGDHGVGKTSLFNRMKTGEFIEVHTLSSRDGESWCYTTTLGDDTVKVTLWDFGQRERFRTGNWRYTENIYRKADGICFVYSVVDYYTFQNLPEWVEDVTRSRDIESIELALIGNKCDLKFKVEEHQIKESCKQLQTKLHYCVSAKTGENVVEAFNGLVTAVHHRNVSPPKEDCTKMSTEDIKKQSKCFCC